MRGVLLVAAGGAAGSVLRHLVALALPAAAGGFPWATLAVNLAGSAAIGAAAALCVQGDLRLLLVTGLLGGFTTFSAFSLEAVTLLGRHPALAALYVLASLVLGLACFAVTFYGLRQ